ncbi:TetR family transcriptional regulator [Nocardioides sp.]|uniref:TetR/AcrR family transcriptional regulator n=1 Tax=Nocardioides sp. TaxID=35761 RepID=UPI0025E000AE|nr:TetR family transcriptional regulator [Nocardioides sp.]
MARKTTRRHSQGETSRQAILDATLRIAGQRGYVGTTLAQVTRASGLPASSVYWHFGNKDELLADALDHGLAQWDGTVPPWGELDPERPREDELFAQMAAITRTLDEASGFWRMGLLIALETGPQVGSGPRERFVAARRRALARVADWWQRSLAAERHAGVAGDADDGSTQADAARAQTLALLTMVAMDGLFLTHQSDHDEDLGPLLRLAAVGLDAAARQLSEGLAPLRPTPAAPPMRRVVADPDSSRSRFLEAAASVAAESGYEGASISRICERAGLPASSLYWHFKDKDDLLAAVIEHSYQEWSLAQPGWLPPEPGTQWQDALRAHFAVSLGGLADRPLFLRMGHQLLLLQRENPPAARERFVAVRRQARLVSREWYADALGVEADDGLPDGMSLLTMVLSDGLFFSNQIDVPTWDVEVFAELVVTMLSTAAERPVAVRGQAAAPS